VHIIDFKTGKNQERQGSLQLPIYQLLVAHCQKWKVSKASYWYLETDDAPIEVELPDPEWSFRQVLEVAKDVKNIRQNSYYKCERDGCFVCKDYEVILEGKAELLGVSGYKDLYFVGEELEDE
jgi:hypothetical protein